MARKAIFDPRSSILDLQFLRRPICQGVLFSSQSPEVALVVAARGAGRNGRQAELRMVRDWAQTGEIIILYFICHMPYFICHMAYEI